MVFYSDQHSISRMSKAEAVGGEGMMQFGRVPHDPNIGIPCANSSQPNGRLERANKTLQDRLKRLHRQGIRTIDAANAMLPELIADYEARQGAALSEGSAPPPPRAR